MKPTSMLATLMAFLAITTGFGLTGCTSFGNLMGNDTVSINNQAKLNYQAMKSELKIDKTSATAKRVHKVYEKLLPYADKANNTGVPFEWELTVFTSDKINAWVMPGGKVGFYTGIVDRLNLTDAEIAAVMGHEMAHALEEHTKEKANFSLARDFGIMGLYYTGFGAVAEAALISENLGTTAYSRSKEREADRIGLQLMAQAGYDPYAGVTFWEKMAGEQKSKTVIDKLDNLLSTHPADDARLQAMKDMQPEVQTLYQKALLGQAKDFVVPTNVKQPLGEKLKQKFKK